MLRRREWARVHPGVYVDHTGPLTWHQRAWAALLYAGPAALAGRSALRAHGVRGHGADDDAVGVLADGCQARRTTAARLGEELRLSTRLPRRGLLLAVVDDVASGALSVLEHRYLLRVERAHALSEGLRQQPERTKAGPTHRDVEYVDQALLLELDGRLGHEWALDRWTDLDRDLHAATSGRLTLRAGWGQVLQPCRLAGLLAAVLTARGWTGKPRACGPRCSLA